MMLSRTATVEQEENPEEALLDSVFFALSDPVRRAILLRLGEEALLVSELAAPFDISLQAVSRHIQVLVRAGLVRQERYRAHQPVQPRCRTDLLGRALAQPLQQILAAAVRSARRHARWRSRNRGRRTRRRKENKR